MVEVFTAPAESSRCRSAYTRSYKGAPSLGLNKKSDSTTAAAIVGTAAVIAALSALFWIPYVWVKVIRKDYSELNIKMNIAASPRWYTPNVDDGAHSQLCGGTTSSWVLFSGTGPLPWTRTSTKTSYPITVSTIAPAPFPRMAIVSFLSASRRWIIYCVRE